jgi:hypothetical protein
MNLDHIRELSDAAKRLSDTVALHFLAATDKMDPVGQWCAFRLDDGTSDGALYPSKDDAMRHQKSDPKLYCYLEITPDGISPKDARHFLKINRHPMIDTTAPEHIINPSIFPRFSNLTPAQKQEAARQERIAIEKANEQ